MITKINDFVEGFNQLNKEVQLVRFSGQNLYHTEHNGKPDYQLAINFIESAGHNTPVWFDLSENNMNTLHQKDDSGKSKYAKTFIVVLVNDGPRKGCYAINTKAKDADIKTEMNIPDGLKKLNFVLAEIGPEKRLNASNVWRCYLQRSATLGSFFSIGNANSENKIPIKQSNDLAKELMNSIYQSV